MFLLDLQFSGETIRVPPVRPKKCYTFYYLLSTFRLKLGYHADIKHTRGPTRRKSHIAIVGPDPRVLYDFLESNKAHIMYIMNK